MKLHLLAPLLVILIFAAIRRHLILRAMPKLRVVFFTGDYYVIEYLTLLGWVKLQSFFCLNKDSASVDQPVISTNFEALTKQAKQLAVVGALQAFKQEQKAKYKAHQIKRRESLRQRRNRKFVTQDPT